MAYLPDIPAPFYSSLPGWLSPAVMEGGRRVALDFTRSLPRRFSGLLLSPGQVPAVMMNPFLARPGFPGQEARREALAKLRAQAKGLMRAHATRLANGLFDEELWQTVAQREADKHLVAASLIGAGRIDAAESSLIGGRLDGVRAVMADRLDTMARRYHVGERTIGQVRGFSGQLGSGTVKVGGQVGGSLWMPSGVRRVMEPESDHCDTCPAKARSYRSLEECISQSGGYPGQGGDQCHDNCNCRLEPAEVTSVYRDVTQALFMRGGFAGQRGL